MNRTEIIQNFTKKSLGLTLVLSAAAFAFAQEKVNVTGKIVDKQNNPIPYASVTFSHPSNKLFSDATLTDEKGQYSLQLVPAHYNITIEAVDFKKQTFAQQISGGNVKNFVLDAESTATLTPTKNIEGVTITAVSSKAYNVEIDKKVYNPAQDLISKGGSLQDVLQNVPSVSVESDGTVSMRGGSNVTFLINGKPSSILGMDDSNALQSIPADQIEKIEVITNPSSKFESAGTAGILNIILKKTRQMGFNGSVEGMIGYLPQTRLNTNLSWRRGNLTYYVNGGGGYNQWRSTSRSNFTLNNRTGISQGTTLSSNQESITNSYNKTYNLTSGLVYDFNDKTSVNFSAMVRGNRNSSENETNYYEDLYLTGLDNVLRTSDGFTKGLAYQFDAGLDKKLNDRGHNLTFAASFQKNDNTTDRTILENSAFGNSLSVIENQINNNTTYLAKIDHELPISEKSKFESGLRWDRNENNYDYTVDQSIANAAYQPVNDFTFDAFYNEMFSAAYAQFKSKIGEKFGYQLGARVENSIIDFDFTRLDGNNQKGDKNYTNVFPSAFLSYNLSKNNQLLFNFTQRIRRPRAFFLIPVRSYQDNRNQFIGNIDLNPAYVDSFELGYALQKSKITINPTLYFRHTKDDFKMYQSRNIDAYGNTVIQTTPMNIGDESTYGLDLNASFDPYSWWKIIANVDLFGYKTTGRYESMDYDGQGFSSRLRLTNTFKPDKKTSLQIQAFYRGGQKTNSMDRKAMYAISLGGNRQIWNNTATIGFNIQDIFNTRAMENVVSTAEFDRYNYNQWMPRTFNLTFSYRFKQGDKVEQPKKKRDTNNNADAGGDYEGI